MIETPPPERKAQSEPGPPLLPTQASEALAEGVAAAETLTVTLTLTREQADALYRAGKYVNDRVLAVDVTNFHHLYIGLVALERALRGETPTSHLEGRA